MSEKKIKSILLGVSGSIAAYKIPDLIRLLRKDAINVIPVLSRGGEQFVTALTLGTVAENKVFRNEDTFNPDIPHLNLAKDTDLFIVAPASANMIAKLAHGFADDLVSALFLSYEGTKCIVPAMHSEMYRNAATQKNLQILKEQGVDILGPVEGDLASGDKGIGRMVDPEIIADKIHSLAYPKLPLSGKKILISAGGTKEPLDKVRVLSNLSTGIMANQLARMASFMGASVTVVSAAQGNDSDNSIIRTLKVETVDEMIAEMEKEFAGTDIVYMAAAVSDFKIKNQGSSKLKRQDNLTLQLEGTPDILAGLSKMKKNQTVFGFCLGEDNLEKMALDKLKKKNVDFMVANKPDVIGKGVRDITIFSRSEEKPLSLKNVELNDLCYELLKKACPK